MRPAPSTTDAGCSALKASLPDRSDPALGTSGKTGPVRVGYEAGIERGRLGEIPQSQRMRRTVLSLWQNQCVETGSLRRPHLDTQGGEIMSISNLQPQSGAQLLIIIGAAFLFVGIHSQVGLNLLILGVGAWLVYNLLNIGRQF